MNNKSDTNQTTASRFIRMSRLFFELLFLTLCLSRSHSMMIRNDALISKMVSDFQKDNTMASNAPRPEQPPSQPQPKNVLTLMQNVLCKNFPSIPCDMIVEDETLRKLIERSIQQLKYKKLSMEKTTPMPGYHLTLFPTINSEDLSNFLQVSDTGYYTKTKPEKSRVRKHKKRLAKINLEQTQDGETKKKGKGKKESTRTTLYNGRKKIRKFYPHKIKYKDKMKGRKDFGDYSEEKLSMSVEVPDMNVGGRKRINYKVEPADPPVWRIDYMKHGEPSLNMFGYEPDRLKEKLVKSGPSVMVSESILEQASRKDVLHPDVYIKKNFIRKNALEMNSGAID